MKTITVVTNASVWGDEKENIIILDENDVNRLVSSRIATIQDDIKDINRDIGKKEKSLNDAINSLKSGVLKNAADVDEQMKNLSDQINNLQNSFQKKGKELSDTFVKECSADVKKYFETLSEYAKMIEKEVSNIRESKQLIDEQLKLSSAIAKYFLNLFEADLEKSSEELSTRKVLIEEMTSLLAQTNITKK